MKISIIGGAGVIGSLTAFLLAQHNWVKEICLIDVNKNLAKAHEMDMGQAVKAFSHTQIISGEDELLADSDIVVIAAGVSEKQISSRLEYLQGNIKVINDIAAKLAQYCPQAAVITVTNPVDVINSVLHHATRMDRHQLIGFSLNDTHRFRWAISNVLGVDFNCVEAYVIGEHGEHQVPLYSSIRNNHQKVRLTKTQKDKVSSIISNWFKEYQALNSGRTSGWLSAFNITKMIECMVRGSEDPVPCSVIGDDGVSIGRLVSLNKTGVQELINIDMEPEEREKWMEAKVKIKNILSQYL